jgi:hypothetical protein
MARLSKRPGCIPSLLLIDRFTDLRVLPPFLLRPLK